MFTRVTIQGSLVALQQHIRSKAPAASTRDRSHSLDETTSLDQRTLAVNDPTSQHTFPQFVAPAPVAVDYRGWGTTASSATSATVSAKGAEANVVPAHDESEEEVVLGIYNCGNDDAPSATYNFGSRDVVVHNVCSFLELWLNSFRTADAIGSSCNPHGWECLRRQRSVVPSCHSNSSNNYNTAHASCGHPLHYVYGTTIPTISMKDYLLRLTEYFRTTDAVFIVAAHYFSRVVKAHQDREDAQRSPIITPWSLHRVYFACCVLAAKWLEDTPFDNQYYASVGGISTFELSKVETALLSLLDFNVYVSRDTVDTAWSGLQRLGSHLELSHDELVTLALPHHFLDVDGAMGISSLSSNRLSVAAAPFKPSGVASNWYRPQTAPMFPYHGPTATYNYGQQYMSIVGTY